MTPDEWRATYPEAAAALRNMVIDTGPKGTAGSEAAIQSEIRLEAARRGQVLYRNNVGAFKDERGNFVRYGLANSTKQENATFASADLIGIYPLLITSAHVGTTVGQFYSVEVKKPGGRVAVAQENWAALVTARGGRAVIIDSVEKLP